MTYIDVTDEHAGTTARVAADDLTDYLISITSDDSETREAIEQRNMDYLQGIVLTDVDDDDLEPDVWLREVVTPTLNRAPHKYRDPSGAVVTATDWATTRSEGSRFNDRAYPCEAEVTYHGHTRHARAGSEIEMGETTRSTIIAVRQDAALARLDQRSRERRAAERALDRARAEQRDAMAAAANLGVTRYRIAQVTGLSQPGVAKSLDRC